MDLVDSKLQIAWGSAMAAFCCHAAVSKPKSCTQGRVVLSSTSGN